MIDLTPEQQRELRSEEPARVRDPETGQVYFLVRAAEFERMRAMLDDTVYATGELVDRVMAEDDAKDPYLDEYQSAVQERNLSLKEVFEHLASISPDEQRKRILKEKLREMS